MEVWLKVFVVTASAAIIMQMLILLGMYLQFRRMNQRMTRIATDLHARFDPILTHVHLLLEDSHSRITSMVADAAEIAHLARGQAVKVDRLFTEAVDRMRLQVIRADQLLSSAIDSIEEAGTDFRKTVLVPVQQAAAFIKGIRAGLEFFSTQRRSPERAREHQDEGLFI